ncbi:MAG: translation initiation factor IF-2 N-terminal domain-containing protein [Planctomycetes bacterium]|nr:translation initiation factor IF-2 N-terminal domain-containing protein [Planctomycetota bacterium]
MSEKMRVHILAKTLNVPSKVILEKCRAEGLGSVVKNHMSTLSAGLDATIREWFSEGSHDTVLETTARIDLGKARRKRRPATTVEAPTPTGAVVTAESGVPVSKDVAAPVVAGVSATEQSSPSAVDEKVEAGVVTVAEAPAVETAAPIADVMVDVDDTAPSSAGVSVPASDPGLSEVASGREDNGSAIIAADEAFPAAVAATESPADAGVVKDSGTDEAEEHPDRSGEPPGGAEAAEDSKKPDPIQAAGPQNVPAPAKLQGPRVVRYEPIDYSAQRAPRSSPPRPSPGDTAPVRPPVSRPAPGVGEGRKAGPRRGRISPRRAAGRTSEAGERLTEYRDRDLAERRQRLAGATGRRIHGRRSAHGGAAAAAEPKTDVTINEPIYMKDFCAATGLNFIQCLTALRDEQNLIANINMVLPSEAAQLLAMHFDITLHVVAAKTKLDEIKEQFAKRERAHSQSRPPVVTVLGHVDHGKTSLLDAFRKTKVVATEDGGITQHIGATHIKTPHGTVTFLDTPGHAAFTAMRARGAELTDVVVLIIAADDGVMPQTVEAINHAKAAKVPVVVALTKIDLGDQNKLKIYGQLTEHGLTPSGEWGGEIDVIETSATTGRGIDELVEHLAELSHLLELKADPTIPASGAVIEAKTKAGVGAVIQVLVQDGTLKVGRTIVCGNAAGKVRALLNDRGERIQEAGPAMPVEVWGLDEVPSSGDKFFELTVAAGEGRRRRNGRYAFEEGATAISQSRHLAGTAQTARHG